MLALPLALRNLATLNLQTGANALFATLGYASDKTEQLPTPDAAGFARAFGHTFSKTALEGEWTRVELLFQLTGDEVGGQLSLAGDEFNAQRFESFLFFAVELKGDKYSRGALAGMARELNKPFPAPVIVLFRHGGTVSLASLHRRENKNNSNRDVLDRVVLLKDIRLENPHRAQLDILNDLAGAKTRARDWKGFLAEWNRVLDLSELNKKFYRELSNWFFAAREHARFPDTGDNAVERGLIRLITRIIFTWFIKERGLVPDAIFDPTQIVSLLKKSDGDSDTYYRAVLQNLFFATLNSEMGERRFRATKGGPNGQAGDYGLSCFFRFKNDFKRPQAWIDLVRDVPFLNGGLFECLDPEDKDGGRIDGFSDVPSRQAHLPNKLFWGEEFTADLSGAYDDKKQKAARVIPLLNLLHSYKFTIDENTPLEEDVALDPELLGKVFENLLASYNPETRTTARKQTGSFYTPREIVNYMVEEALAAYLAPFAGGGELKALLSDADARRADELGFSPAQIETLVGAIERCTILDPACGSGAFPMGALSKMVALLRKLDPENNLWRAAQLRAVAERLKSHAGESEAKEEARRETQAIFEDNDPDYARKLYLIERCLFGVDIQPIALQISKLRFFIALVINQRIDPAKPNFNIRALPNLETKFVAANTLIAPTNQLPMTWPDLDQLVADLDKVRRQHIAPRSRAEKKRLEKRDAELVAAIEQEMVDNRFDKSYAEPFTVWKPYDQKATCPFFSPASMFGSELKGGFDVVIANPPYLGEKGNKETFRHIAQNSWGKDYYQRKMDLFYFFLHRAIDLCRDGSVLCFITTNYYLTADGAIFLRNDLYKRTIVLRLNNFGELKIFPSALGQHNLITIARKGSGDTDAITFISNRRGEADREQLRQILSGADKETQYFAVPQSEIFQGRECFINLSGSRAVTDEESDSSLEFRRIDDASSPLHTFAQSVFMGVQTGADVTTHSLVQAALEKGTVTQKQADEYKIGSGIYVLTKTELESMNPNQTEREECIKEFFKNSQIERYFTPKTNPKYLLYVDSSSDIDRYPNIKNHLLKYRPLLAAREQAVIEKRNWFWIRGSKREAYFYRTDFIVVPYRATASKFSLCNQDIFGAGDTYYVTLKNGLSTKALLGYLNSSLVLFHLSKRGKRKGSIIEYYKRPLESIPVHPALFEEPWASKFESLVEQIIKLKMKDKAADVRSLEIEIDYLVYRLFGLSKDEIAIIEKVSVAS